MTVQPIHDCGVSYRANFDDQVITNENLTPSQLICFFWRHKPDIRPQELIFCNVLSLKHGNSRANIVGSLQAGTERSVNNVVCNLTRSEERRGGKEVSERVDLGGRRNNK